MRAVFFRALELSADSGSSCSITGSCFIVLTKRVYARYTAVDLAFRVQVELHLHRADQLFQMRRIAEMHDIRHDLGAQTIQETQTLAADRDCFDRLALAFSSSLNFCSDARSTLVFMPPHRPLSVVTRMMPAAFAPSFVTMNG